MFNSVRLKRTRIIYYIFVGGKVWKYQGRKSMMIKQEYVV